MSSERVVITTRLRGKLTPLEIVLYESDRVLRGLLSYSAFRLSGETLDGWNELDLVSFALERAAKLGEATPAAMRHWISMKVINLRVREKKIKQIPSGLNQQELWDRDETRLPVEVLAWLQENIPNPRMAAAIQDLAEENLTVKEAADRYSLIESRLERALTDLRSEWDADE